MPTQDGLSPLERQDYLSKIASLRQQDVVTSRGFLDLYGYAENGEFVLAPNSFAKGYQDSFLLPNQRPYITLNLLGLFGKLSNGTWIFIPSYSRGLTYGNERQSNLKFAILAEGERRLFQALEAQKQSQSSLEVQLKEAMERVKELEKQLGKGRK